MDSKAFDCRDSSTTLHEMQDTLTEYLFNHADQPLTPKRAELVSEHCANIVRKITDYSVDRRSPVDIVREMSESLTPLVAASRLPGIKDTFVQTLAPAVFETITDPTISGWCGREILKKFNVCVQNSDKNMRRRIVQDNNLMHLYKLVDLLSVCGDYDYQTCITECVYRMCSREQLREYSEDLIPEDEELREAFLAINSSSFDCDVRKFLDILNEKSKNVYSVVCEQVLIDNISLPGPKELTMNGIWVDFNLVLKSISWYVDENFFSGDGHHLFLLPQESIEFVGTETLSETIKITLKLSGEIITDVTHLRNVRLITLTMPNTRKAKFIRTEVVGNIFQRKHPEKYSHWSLQSGIQAVSSNHAIPEARENPLQQASIIEISSDEDERELPITENLRADALDSMTLEPPEPITSRRAVYKPLKVRYHGSSTSNASSRRVSVHGNATKNEQNCGNGGIEFDDTQNTGIYYQALEILEAKEPTRPDEDDNNNEKVGDNWGSTSPCSYYGARSIINDEIRDAKEPESEYYTAQLLTVFSENEVVSHLTTSRCIRRDKENSVVVVDSDSEIETGRNASRCIQRNGNLASTDMSESEADSMCLQDDKKEKMSRAIPYSEERSEVLCRGKPRRRKNLKKRQHWKIRFSKSRKGARPGGHKRKSSSSDDRVSSDEELTSTATVESTEAIHKEEDRVDISENLHYETPKSSGDANIAEGQSTYIDKPGDSFNTGDGLDNENFADGEKSISAVPMQKTVPLTQDLDDNVDMDLSPNISDGKNASVTVAEEITTKQVPDFERQESNVGCKTQTAQLSVCDQSFESSQLQDPSNNHESVANNIKDEIISQTSTVLFSNIHATSEHEIDANNNLSKTELTMHDFGSTGKELEMYQESAESPEATESKIKEEIILGTRIPFVKVNRCVKPNRKLELKRKPLKDKKIASSQKSSFSDFKNSPLVTERNKIRGRNKRQAVIDDDTPTNSSQNSANRAGTAEIIEKDVQPESTSTEEDVVNHCEIVENAAYDASPAIVMARERVSEFRRKRKARKAAEEMLQETVVNDTEKKVGEAPDLTDKLGQNDETYVKSPENVNTSVEQQRDNKSEEAVRDRVTLLDQEEIVVEQQNVVADKTYEGSVTSPLKENMDLDEELEKELKLTQEKGVEGRSKTEFNTTRTTTASGRRRRLFDPHDLTYLDGLLDIKEQDEDVTIRTQGEQKSSDRPIGIRNSKRKNKYEPDAVPKKVFIKRRLQKPSINALLANKAHRRKETHRVECPTVDIDKVFRAAAKRFEQLCKEIKETGKETKKRGRRPRPLVENFSLFDQISGKQKVAETESIAEQPLNKISDDESIHTQVSEKCSPRIPAEKRIKVLSHVVLHQNVSEAVGRLEVLDELPSPEELPDLMEPCLDISLPASAEAATDKSSVKDDDSSKREFVWNWIECGNDASEVKRALRQCSYTIKSTVQNTLDQIRGPVPDDVATDYQMLEQIDNICRSLNL